MIPKPDHHLQPEDIDVLRRNAQRALRFREKRYAQGLFQASQRSRQLGFSTQHQTSTARFVTCGRNRVTPVLPRSRWFVPTSTPKPRAEGSSPSAPAKKPAKTLGFRRFSFCMCCMVMWFTLVQTLAFSIRFYPFSTVLIPSSTQNAPGFAFFGPNRVRFSLSRCFGTAKFLPAFCASCYIVVTS